MHTPSDASPASSERVFATYASRRASLSDGMAAPLALHPLALWIRF